jgi:hypothetical protein
LEKKLNIEKELNRLKDAVNKIDLSTPFQTVICLSKATAQIKKIASRLGRRQQFLEYTFKDFTDILYSIIMDKLISSGFIFVERKHTRNTTSDYIRTKGDYTEKVLNYFHYTYLRADDTKRKKIKDTLHAVLNKIEETDARNSFD